MARIELVASFLSPPISRTCGRNLNLLFSASIRCSELSGITRTKAECIFVYVKDKQMNKVDFPTRPQTLEKGHPLGGHRRGGLGVEGLEGRRVAPAGHYLHNNYAAQCSCLQGIFNFKVIPELEKCLSAIATPPPAPS